MAYLEFNRSGGNTYVYLNEYVGEQKYSTRKEMRIVRLGRIEKALMTLKMWKIDQNLIPKELPKEHYKNINDWIKSVRNRAVF